MTERTTTKSWEVAPLAATTRGGVTESVHYGAVAVVDADGHLLAQAGDSRLVTFSRSALKPIQVLPTVRRGFPAAANLNARHLAVACGSHGGEPDHVDTVREILTAGGFSEIDLRCGVHAPSFLRYITNGRPPIGEWTQLHNNCSGKHAAILQLSRWLDENPASYLEPTSRPQQEIRATVAETCSLDPDNLTAGIDGCSLPNYAMPLYNIARAYARLCAGARADDPAFETITNAMRRHPRMVSGTGRFDLALTDAVGGRLIAKVGGEAIECVGLPGEGIAVALKVADGNTRAIGPAMIAVLRSLDWISDKECESLLQFVATPLTNHRDIRYGEIRPVVELRRHNPRVSID